MTLDQRLDLAVGEPAFELLGEVRVVRLARGAPNVGEAALDNERVDVACDRRVDAPIGEAGETNCFCLGVPSFPKLRVLQLRSRVIDAEPRAQRGDGLVG